MREREVSLHFCRCLLLKDHPGKVLERERRERKERGIIMAGNFPISQDWEPVVIRKKTPTAAARKDEKAVNAARRSGAEIETIRKCI